MKAATNFAAFQDLKDLTQATDEQLAGMLAYGCTEHLAVNYEDVLTEHLLRLFRHITGVDWIRGWEQGARPDKQYATIWLYGATPIGSPSIERRLVIDPATNEIRDDQCEVVTQIFEFQFQLDSYRDNGEADRNQEIATQVGPHYSAADVLVRLVTAFGHSRFRSAMAEKCVYLGHKPFGEIRNYAKPLVTNTFEGRAGVDFRVRGAPISSLRVPTFDSVDWGFECPVVLDGEYPTFVNHPAQATQPDC